MSKELKPGTRAERSFTVQRMAEQATGGARAMRGRVEIQEAMPYVPGNLMVLATMMALIDDDE